MSAFSYDALAQAVMVLFALVGIALTVLNLIKAIRDVKKPHDDHIHMVHDHENKLVHDYEVIEEHGERLDRLEASMKEMEGQNRIIISALKAQLLHEIDGVNHIEDLKVEYGILSRYLSGDLANMGENHG